eukprot:g48378.t1
MQEGENDEDELSRHNLSCACFIKICCLNIQKVTWEKKNKGQPRVVRASNQGVGRQTSKGGNVSARFLCSGSPALRRQAHSHFSFDVLQLQRRRNLPRTWHGITPLHTPGPGRTGKFRSVRKLQRNSRSRVH